MAVIFQLTWQTDNSGRKKEYDAAERIYVKEIENNYAPNERAAALEAWIVKLKEKFPQPPKYIQYRLEWYQKKLRELEKSGSDDFTSSKKPPETIPDEKFLQSVPKRAEIEKSKETAGLKTAKVDDVKIRFRGEEAEGKVEKMGFRKAGDRRFKFFVEFSGAYEDFDKNREKFMDEMTEYVRSEKGVDDLLGMLRGGILEFYSSFGVERGFELSGEELETLKKRAATIKFEHKDLRSIGYVGFSNHVKDATEVLYGNAHIFIGGIAGAAVGIIAFSGPAFVAAGIIGICLSWMIGDIFGSKIRNLQITSFDAMPHEMFHALSDNSRKKNGIVREYDRRLEEGMASEIGLDWAYPDYRDSIRRYVDNLKPSDKKEALNLLTRDWLNLKMSGEDDNKVERIKRDIFGED